MAKRKSRRPERPVGEEPPAPPRIGDGRGAEANHHAPSAVPDYYTLLGVEPWASPEVIALAYRRMAAACARRLGSEQGARQLKLINAAYLVLGNQARRADYDRLYGIVQVWRRSDGPEAPGDEETIVSVPSHALSVSPSRRLGPSSPRSMAPSPRPGLPHWRAGGRFELFALAVIAAVALGTGAVVVGIAAPLNLGPAINEAAYILGLAPSPRAAELELEEAESLEAPLEVVPTMPAPEPTALPLEAQFEGTTVLVEPSNPRPGTVVTVTTGVVRNGEPVAGLPLYAVARFRTVNERWPPGSATVRTDERGVARISFNIGNATRGHTVRVEVIGEVEGQQLVWHGAFTPP